METFLVETVDDAFLFTRFVNTWLEASVTSVNIERLSLKVIGFSGSPIESRKRTSRAPHESC